MAFNSCKNRYVAPPKKDLSKTDFIYLKEKKFMLKDSVFFPLMLNYVINFRKIGDKYVVSSLKDYENPQIFEGNTIDSNLTVLKGHLQLIKELGFNTIRLVGLNNMNSGETPSIKLYSDTPESLGLIEKSDIILDSFNEVIKIAENLGLRIMVLLKGPIDDPDNLEFTKKLLTKYKENPTIFSYDFMNEPLYFDNSNFKDYGKRKREKESAYDIAVSWKRLMDEYAPNQLMTIGYSEPIEIFEWDPSILPVDFMAFHTYVPLRVPNEIYWYSKYIDRPWMIGETALPADNDSVSYQQQHQYLIEAYKRVVNCGGAGFGWWAFQDVSWGGFEHDYTSIMNHQGYTYTQDSTYKIKGSLKPVAYEFKNLKNYKPTYDCPCATNYYNMLAYKNYVIHGQVIDEDSKPIEGAVIRGWNKYYSIAANTFTNAKGEFTLYSNDKFVHFSVSAPGKTLVNFNLEIKYQKNPNIETNNELTDVNLESQFISYMPYFADKSILDSSFVASWSKDYIFNFDPKYFNNSIYTANIDAIELEEVDF